MKMKLIETFDINIGGIFRELNGFNKLNFLNNDNVYAYDISYYLENSGDKKISLYYERLLRLHEEGKIENPLEVLANALIMEFSNKWNKIHDLLITSYNPLEDFKFKEVDTPDITKTKKESTNTNLSTIKNNNSKNNVSAFNTSNYSPSDEEIETYSDTISGNSDSNFIETNEKELGVRTKETNGTNKKTYQELIESELSLREYNFKKIIFEDVDSVLCKLIYE